MQIVTCAVAIELSAELRSRIRQGLRRIAPRLPDPRVTARVALRREGRGAFTEVSVPAGRRVIAVRGVAPDAGTSVQRAMEALDRACPPPPALPAPAKSVLLPDSLPRPPALARPTLLTRTPAPPSAFRASARAGTRAAVASAPAGGEQS